MEDDSKSTNGDNDIWKMQSKSPNGDNDIWKMIVSQLIVISLYVIPLCQ
jgi:hypothetical protein